MSKHREQFFFGHGKILLTGEYFVLDGAQALAMPTSLGQTLTVKYKKSFEPKLIWKSYDVDGRCWFEAVMELWRFNLLEGEESETFLTLKNILTNARKLNPHFMRDEGEITVETKLDFPVDWGLGSSSSLIYNIAQWAYVSPFELAFRSLGGSGYDIACAQSMGPIFYQKKESGPSWMQVEFFPEFHENLYFVYLERKAKTRDAINFFQKCSVGNKQQVINQISHLTEELLKARTLIEFESVLIEHEKIISESLGLTTVKKQYFADYWGSIKSLGAWGGDFVMVTSYRSEEETKQYFLERGFKTIIPFQELISRPYSRLAPGKFEIQQPNETLST